MAVQLQHCGVLPPWHFARVHVVHPYSSIETTTAWKKLHFILSALSDFYTFADNGFVSRVLMSVSVDYDTIGSTLSWWHYLGAIIMRLFTSLFMRIGLPICMYTHADASIFLWVYVGKRSVYACIYISGAEMGLVLLVPGTTNNSVNVIQNGLKIIHSFQANILSLISIKLRIYSSFDN